ncbi:MAG: DNA translocase FtsK 4TM domain-containing protein [Proteobacteria bacterium]|nr:DNA translocase FtsK 4TM domain-containing protein [Pseudomonadota bacterium]
MQKKKTSADNSKRKKQQAQPRRGSSQARKRVNREPNEKRPRNDNPRTSVQNPRRIQKQSKIYAFCIAAVFIILGVILFLMLLSFSAADLAEDAETAVNIFGIVGAYIANVLLTLFGLASFLFAAMSLLMGLRTAFGREFEISATELIGLIMLLLGSSPVLAHALNGAMVLDNEPGGVLGKYLAEFGLAHLPAAGFFSACAALCLFGALLATDTKFSTFFKALWKGVKWTGKTLGNALAEPFRKPKEIESQDAKEDDMLYSDGNLSNKVFEEEMPPEKPEESHAEAEREVSEHNERDADDEDMSEPETDAVHKFDDDAEIAETANADNEDEDEAETSDEDEEDVDDPDGLISYANSREMANLPEIIQEKQEKQEKAGQKQPEALADIMARIRKASPKPRTIKRSHSVPALEPAFEFESIVEPEDIGTSRMPEDAQEAAANLNNSILHNWKPRSITAPKTSRKTQESDTPTLALDSIQDETARKARAIPAPEMPSNITKDLLAQLSEDMSASNMHAASEIPTAAVTRIASNTNTAKKLFAGLADTAEIERPAPKANNASERLSMTTRAPDARENTVPPISADLRALIDEAGYAAPRNTAPRAAVQPNAPGTPKTYADSTLAATPSQHSFVVAEEKKCASEDELRDAERAMVKKQGQIAAYHHPPLSLLHYNPETQKGFDNDALRIYADKIVEKLAEYNVHGQVVQICPGPIITRFEFAPAPGTKVSKIAGLSDDLMMALEIKSIRILAPIPGKGVVGIEIPNEKRNTIYLKEVLGSKAFLEAKSILTIALGKDSEGNPVVSDLAKMPHLLVAGSTGSGKSVGINTMICSLLFNATPDEVKFILVDPKCLELSIYEGIPHLLVPPITTPQETISALEWACEEMDERYKLLASFGVRNIATYNEQIKNPTLPRAIECAAEKDENGEPRYKQMPYIVIVVDEFADLIMTAGKEIERSIMRLAQKARAAGIHIILATQRPSSDIITGVIKANFPTRLAFRVFSSINSKVILDDKGAEALLGNGDSLFLPPNSGILQRVHGAYVSDEEVQDIVSFLAKQRAPEYNPDITAPRNTDDPDDENAAGGNNEFDALYDQAVQIVAETGQASASFLQRRLSIGFNRASRIVEQLEREGVVGPMVKGKREVLISPH